MLRGYFRMLHWNWSLFQNVAQHNCINTYTYLYVYKATIYVCVCVYTVNIVYRNYNNSCMNNFHLMQFHYYLPRRRTLYTSPSSLPNTLLSTLPSLVVSILFSHNRIMQFIISKFHFYYYCLSANTLQMQVKVRCISWEGNKRGIVYVLEVLTLQGIVCYSTASDLTELPTVFVSKYFLCFS